jgi:hypothetical protein
VSLVKTQVYLEAEQRKVLKELAKRRHVSLSGLIREAMEQYISIHKIASGRTPRKRPSFIGIGSSGLTDVSINHDKYIGEAIAEEHGIR